MRLRIVQAFLGDRTLTTGHLREELPDVPAATLYRQISSLAEAGVLEVADERRVRGAVERTYRLRAGAGSVDDETARAMSAQEHRAGFLSFVASLLAQFDRYLDQQDPDPVRDFVGYRQAAMQLSDEEMRELVTDLRRVLEPRLALPPAMGRRRRLLATVFVPD